MIFEYECAKKHRTEKIFLKFGVETPTIVCPNCGGTAQRLEFSVPAPGMFFGDPGGYYKPSPRKRFSNKLAAQKGNSGSTG